MSKPFSFGSQSLNGYVPDTRRAKPRGLFYCLGRTGRVRNEPMFGVAAKGTECAFRGQRENLLQVGAKMDTGGLDLWKDIVFRKDKEALNKMVESLSVYHSLLQIWRIVTDSLISKTKMA